MPFLERGNSSRTTEALLWEGDEYRPGNSSRRGLDEIGSPASLVQPRRRLCGSAECASGWTMPWRNRRRPVFEEQWGCSGQCVLAMV
ncbi:MAG: hypothetical protein ABI380_07330, partial [Edaphobacter sp.]